MEDVQPLRGDAVPPLSTSASRSDGAAVEAIVAWIESHLGGTVTACERQARWRPVWFVDLDRDGEHLALCARGDRTDMNLTFPLVHEMRFQSVMYDHGIPTPRVHGLIDEPLAYVMDRVPGRADFAGSTVAERDAVVDEYLTALVALHALPIEPFVAAGIDHGRSADESATVGMRRFEANWRSMKRTPEPFLEFALGWLRRNPPRSRGRQAAVVWDSGQFHHHDGHLVAILDVELGHIGDPMIDLAAWRQRDTVLGFGSMPALYARYAELSGQPVDIEAIQRHHFAFTLSNQLSVGPATRHPAPASDLMTNLQWCCETNLFATEALAELLDIELPTVDVPEPQPSPADVVLNHLVGRLGAVTSADEYLRYELRTMFRMARHAARLNEIGGQSTADDLDDLHHFLGHRPASWLDGEAELERFVLAHADTARYDEALCTLFHKRQLRAQMLLGPAGSAMTRHAAIQPFTRAG